MVLVSRTLGAVCLMSGRYADPERTYREDLEKWKNNGWSLYAQSRALHDTGKIKDARETEQQYRTAWANADEPTTTSCKCIPKTYGAPRCFP